MTGDDRFGADDLVLCAGTLVTTPFVDRLAPARDAGFRGVSLQPMDVVTFTGDGRSPADLVRLVDDHGLVVAEFDAITTWDDDHEPPAAWGPDAAAMKAGTAENLIPLAAAVGARSVSIVEYYGVALGTDRAAAGFARACDVAADHGLMVTLEFLPWTGVPTLADAIAIVRAAGRPNGGILVDSWHLFRSGATLGDLAAVPGDLVGYVQIDDAPATPEADLGEETTHRRLVPGDGDLDLAGFVRTLRAIGYDGPLGVEVYSDDLAAMPAAEAAQRCATGTRRVLAAAR
ncbi:MAG: sugar phosphate isomerase/epimerase family protein [Acidimicrobiia bacterium]